MTTLTRWTTRINMWLKNDWCVITCKLLLDLFYAIKHLIYLGNDVYSEAGLMEYIYKVNTRVQLTHSHYLSAPAYYHVTFSLYGRHWTHHYLCYLPMHSIEIDIIEMYLQQIMALQLIVCNTMEPLQQPVFADWETIPRRIQSEGWQIWIQYGRCFVVSRAINRYTCTRFIFKP